MDDTIKCPFPQCAELRDCDPLDGKKEDVSQLLLYFRQWVAHDATRSIDLNEEMNIPCGGGRGAATAAAAGSRAAVAKAKTGASLSTTTTSQLQQCSGREYACPAVGGGRVDDEGGGGGTFEAAPPPHSLPFLRTMRSFGGVQGGNGTDNHHTEGTTNAAADAAAVVVSSPVNFASSFLDLDVLSGPVRRNGLSSPSSLRTGRGGQFQLDGATGLGDRPFPNGRPPIAPDANACSTSSGGNITNASPTH